MTQYLLILIKLSAGFLALFIVAELLYRFADVPAEHTRKLVHVGTGLLTLLFPLYFETTWQVVVICSMFLLILYVSKHTGLLPSINKIERKSAGSLLYPVIVIVVFAFYEYMKGRYPFFDPLLYFYLPILAMAIGDPVAAIAGGGLKQTNNKKTNRGTIGCFIAVSILTCLLMYYFNTTFFNRALFVFFAIPLGIVVAITERVSGGGWDNFTMPAATCAYLWILSTQIA